MNSPNNKGFHTPLQNNRRLIDSYYNIALSGSLTPIKLGQITPKVMGLESEKKIEQQPDIDTSLYVGDDFLQAHRLKLDRLQEKLASYSREQDNIAAQLRHLAEEMDQIEVEIVTRDVNTKLGYDDSFEDDDVDSLASMDSDIMIDLDYKLTSFMKQHYDNPALISKIHKLRNMVNNGVELVRDDVIISNEHDRKKLSKRFLNELGEMVNIYTRGKD